MALHGQLANDRVERARITERELLAFHALPTGLLGVTAEFDARAGVDLRDTEFHRRTAQLGGFARRKDEAGVGHRQAQDGDEELEVLVTHQVAVAEIDARGGTQARKADGVRTTAVAILEKNCVADQAKDIEAPICQAEESTNAKVILAHFEGAAEGVEAPQVVALERVARMHALVGLVVVRLHEDLVRPDAGRLHGAEPSVIQRRGVDVHATDFAVSALHVVDVSNTGRDEVGVVAWVLAEYDDEALVPLLFHRHNLLADLIHAQRAADHVLVLVLETAVGTVVHAQVAEIERREEHDAIAVHALLEIAGGGKNLLAQLGAARAQEDRGLLDGERLFVERLGDHLAQPTDVHEIGAAKKAFQVGIVDKVLSVLTQRLRQR